MEDSLTPQTDDGHTTYVQWFEDAEHTTQPAREKSERDRDYYDNKQLTAEEKAELEARGQPPIAFNVIKSRVDYLLGLEKQQRRDPKAYYRNEPDQPAAEAFTKGLRFCADKGRYLKARKGAWKNVVIEGYGGIELSAKLRSFDEQTGQSDADIACEHVPWDRIFYDPYSAKDDFTDARYLGQVFWSDIDEAIERAVGQGADEDEAREILESTLNHDPLPGQTYGDKPLTRWADKNRRRVRVVSMWHRKAGEWQLCEFTKAGKLVEMPSPFQTKDGESLCPLILASAYVDRDNNRYGEVRNLIDPQDEVNKRRSKALHQSVSRGVIADEGAVADVNKARKELTRPDFWIEKTPNSHLEVIDGVQLAAGQAALLADAMSYIQQASANSALTGKGQSDDQSGRAIEARQAGGMIELAAPMDVLESLDHRAFVVMGAAMQQYWTAEKWVRITDDELAPEAVGLNVPVMAPDPMTGQPVPTGQVENKLADMDVDIIVGDAPHVIALQGDEYQAFVQSLPMLAQMPPAFAKIAVKTHPGLTLQQKRECLEALDEMSKPQEKPPEALAAEQRQREMEEAEIADTRASAYSKLATGEEKMARVGMGMPMPDMAEGMMDGPPGGAGQGAPPAPQMPGRRPQPPQPTPGPPEGLMTGAPPGL